MILRILNYFGAKGTFILSHRLSALQSVYNVLNDNPNFMWVTVFISAFQFPETSFQRELATCVNDCGGKKRIGEGVQEAAMANINLPLAVILPRLYSELHIYFYEKYGILYAPLVFTMLMHLLVSEAVVHKLWPERDENGNVGATDKCTGDCVEQVTHVAKQSEYAQQPEGPEKGEIQDPSS